MNFIKTQHAEKELSSAEDKISPEETISELGHLKSQESIDINKNRTVAELEGEFYDKLGIAVQVSRRTGNIWIETSQTDDRTLGMQNKQGEMSSPTNVYNL